MRQYGAAFDVAQEVQAQTAAFAGTGDQPGHVGDGEGGVAARDDAEVGDQSGEGVVGDLRLGRRENGHKRRLTGGGESEQTDVGYRLEFENQVTLDTVLTEECETGSFAGFRRQRCVAESAAAALSGVEA